MAKTIKTTKTVPATAGKPDAQAQALRDSAMLVSSSLASPDVAWRHDLERMARNLCKLGYLRKTVANGAAGYWPTHIAR